MKNDTYAALHEKKIDELFESYQRLGYHVIKNPKPTDMPFTVGHYVPDLIVLKKDGSGFFIEVKTRTNNLSFEGLQSIAEDVASHSNWRFLLVTLDDTINDTLEGTEYTQTDWDEIQNRLKKAEQIALLDAQDAAILYLWATFEIMARKHSFELNLIIDKLPINQLIKYLYTEAEIAIDQIDAIENFMRTRNRLAHGYSVENIMSSFNDSFHIVNELFHEWKHREC